MDFNGWISDMDLDGLGIYFSLCIWILPLDFSKSVMLAELVVVCCWLGSWFWLYMTVSSEEFIFSG